MGGWKKAINAIYTKPDFLLSYCQLFPKRICQGCHLQHFEKIKPPRANLTFGEKEALKSLRQNEDIVIAKADKGNVTVVMNKEDYSSFADQRQGWVPYYQDCHHEETSDFGSENDPIWLGIVQH